MVSIFQAAMLGHKVWADKSGLLLFQSPSFPMQLKSIHTLLIEDLKLKPTSFLSEVGVGRGIAQSY